MRVHLDVGCCGHRPFRSGSGEVLDVTRTTAEILAAFEKVNFLPEEHEFADFLKRADVLREMANPIAEILESFGKFMTQLEVELDKVGAFDA